MSNPDVYWLEGDDPALKVAARTAQAHFKYFWRELTWEYRRIVPGLDLAAVKAPFSDSCFAVFDQVLSPGQESPRLGPQLGAVA